MRFRDILRAGFLLPVLVAGGAEYGLTDYDVTPTGAKTVYAGHDALVPFWVAYGETGLTRYFYFDSVTGLPEGVTADIFCANNGPYYSYSPCTGTPLRAIYPRRLANYAIHVTAAASAVPGDYTITLNTHDYEGHTHATAIPLRVLAAPAAPSPTVTYQPPIPGLATWRQKMVSEGARFCSSTTKNQTYQFGYEGSVWYYDGARVFYQIHDYTGESIWKECAENVASQYADFVNAFGCNTLGCGGIPAWRVFPRGLRMAYERTGLDKYRLAVENLAANGLYTQKPGSLIDGGIRETAYAAASLIEAKLIGSASYDTVYAAKLKTLINQLLAMYETLFDRRAHTIHQAFYDGLAAEVLIDYYRYVTPDARIPAAIRKMLDFTWEIAWDQKAESLAYQPDRMPWLGHNGLLGLVVPAYAWYYGLTGELLYLQRGDELFGHIFDEPFWSGKQFSQTYRWTFDYVKWRSVVAGSVKLTLPEHLYPSGRQRVGVLLPEAAGGKCGEAVRFPGAPAALGMPASVPVAMGSTSTEVPLLLREVETPTPVTITASHRTRCNDPAASGQAMATVMPDHLDVVLSAWRVPGGILHNNRVTLDAKISAEARTITLSSSRPDLVRFLDIDGNVVNTVALAGGASRSAYFYVDTGYVSTSTTVTISASLGSLKGETTLVIEPPLPRLLLTNGPMLVGGFKTCLNQVVIDAPAPEGGRAVSVWSGNTGFFSDTLTVTVPKGEISAFFCITPSVRASGEEYLHMQYGSGKYATTYTEAATRTLSVSMSSSSVAAKKTATGTVSFGDWIPTGATVALSSNDVIVTVPSSVTVARSTDSSTPAKATFTVTVGNATYSRSVTITATSSTGQTGSVTFTVTL